MIVADSDVLIDGLRGRQDARERIAREIEAGSLVTTSITAFELVAGARDTASLGEVDALLAALPVLPLDEVAGRRAAEIHRALSANREEIGMADSLIAGICLAQGASLLTRNRSHFERVPGLTLA